MHTMQLQFRTHVGLATDNALLSAFEAAYQGAPVSSASSGVVTGFQMRTTAQRHYFGHESAPDALFWLKLPYQPASDRSASIYLTS
jgi:hypothetical protein